MTNPNDSRLAAGQPAQHNYVAVTAPWTQRAIGTLVDAAVLLPGWLLYFIGAAIGGIGTIIMLLGLLLTIATAVYLVYLEGTTGQSIGKRVANIRLVGEHTGAPIGFGPAFIRKLCHILDSVVCYLGWLWPLWDEKHQTLADKLTHTLVTPAS